MSLLKACHCHRYLLLTAAGQLGEMTFKDIGAVLVCVIVKDSVGGSSEC